MKLKFLDPNNIVACWDVTIDDWGVLLPRACVTSRTLSSRASYSMSWWNDLQPIVHFHFFFPLRFVWTKKMSHDSLSLSVEIVKDSNESMIWMNGWIECAFLPSGCSETFGQVMFLLHDLPTQCLKFRLYSFSLASQQWCWTAFQVNGVVLIGAFPWLLAPTRSRAGEIHPIFACSMQLSLARQIKNLSRVSGNLLDLLSAEESSHDVHSTPTIEFDERTPVRLGWGRWSPSRFSGRSKWRMHYTWMHTYPLFPHIDSAPSLSSTT